MNYKKPLDVDQQLVYLQENKNVDINNKTSARTLLIKYGYLNLVTPFKHNFAEKIQNSKYECKKDTYGKHIYLQRQQFTEYQRHFFNERKMYHDLYNGIHKFEMIYKSLVINLFLVKHSITSSQIAVNILNVYKQRINNLVIHTMGGVEEKAVRRSQMENVIDGLIRQISGYTRKNILDPTRIDTVDPVDIYLVLDRMNLSQVNTLYFCMKREDRNRIYRQLEEYSVNLGAKDHVDFLKRVFNLVSIRNSIMHFNSVTILLKYSDYKKKIYRTRTSIRDYEAIIRALIYMSKNIYVE